MRTVPEPGRVLLRGLVWGPVLGGATGAAVWIALCLATLELPGVVLTPFAVVVGAVVGVVPGAVGAGVVALAALRPAPAAVVAGVVCAGLVSCVVVGGIVSGDLSGRGPDVGPGTAFAWWVGLTALFGGVGALGGQLVARPVPIDPGHRGPSSPPSGPLGVGWSPVDAHPRSSCPLDALGGGGSRRH